MSINPRSIKACSGQTTRALCNQDRGHQSRRWLAFQLETQIGCTSSWNNLTCKAFATIFTIKFIINICFWDVQSQLDFIIFIKVQSPRICSVRSLLFRLRPSYWYNLLLCRLQSVNRILRDCNLDTGSRYIELCFVVEFYWAPVWISLKKDAWVIVAWFGRRQRISHP